LYSGTEKGIRTKWGNRMLGLLKKVSITFRITAAILIPVLGLAGLSAAVIAEKSELLRGMTQVDELSELAETVGTLSHAVQRERGASAVYRGSGGKQMAEALAAERRLTDEALANLNALLKTRNLSPYVGLSRKIDVAVASLKELPDQRTQISQLSVAASDMVGHFNRHIDTLLAVIGEITSTARDQDVSPLLQVYVNFAAMKEQAGRERAVGAGGISVGKFTPATYREFMRSVAEQGVYGQLFAAQAPAHLQALYARTAAGEAVDEVNRIRQAVIEGGLEGKLGGVDGPYWYKVTTAKIDLLKKVEDAIAADVRSLAATRRHEALLQLYSAIALVSVASLLAGMMGIAIVRGIVRALRSVEGNAISVLTAAQEISGAIASQAATSNQMSASVAEITSTMEELSSSSSHVAEHSRSVVDAAQKTWENSRSGAESTQRMLERMSDISTENSHSLAVIEDLGRKSKEIGKIMEIIDSVADQTKLIAFNAALEASSAGEAGRRFGVVASEIRRLADSVTASTGEIAKKVEEIQDSINNLVLTSEKGAAGINIGMEEAARTAGELSELVEAAQESSSAAQQISLATEQQKTASGQVLVALREIVSASANTAQSVNRISEITQTMTVMSVDLTDLVRSFKISRKTA
jgi:methyl-accepting chemotaxis protein